MPLKPSRYNLVARQGARVYLFNTHTLNSLALDSQLFESLEGLLRDIADNGQIASTDASASQAVKLLQQHGFVVDQAVDELAEIRHRYDHACRSGPLKLTIVPTGACNMNCHYCYEGPDKNRRAWKLGPEQWNRIRAFAADRLQPDEGLIVHWFGGEPLLQRTAIYRMSEQLMALAQQENASYSAWITSNGYHLDTDTAIKLRACGVKKVQVTFDGSQTRHDQVRYVGSARARRGSFDRIVTNVMAAADLFRFVIRLHVSPSNLDDFKIMVEQLAQRGVPSRVAYAAVHLIESFDSTSRDQAHQAHAGDSFSSREFADIELDLLRFARQHGFALRSPFAHATGCMVDHQNSYLIDADGAIKQCDHYVGDPGSGYSHISAPDRITRPENLARWQTDRFADGECLNCRLFPVCLRGCWHAVMDRGQEHKECPSLRHNWQDILPYFHDGGLHY